MQLIAIKEYFPNKNENGKEPRASCFESEMSPYSNTSQLAENSLGLFLTEHIRNTNKRIPHKAYSHTLITTYFRVFDLI